MGRCISFVGGYEMFCRQCGVKNEEGSRFCESCGTKLAVTGGESSGDEFNRAKEDRNYDDTVLIHQDGSDDSEDITQGLHFYETEEFLQGLYYNDSDETLHGLHHDDLDVIYNNPSEFRKETYGGGAYRDHRNYRDYRDNRGHRNHRDHRENNAKKKHFALLVFVACTFVIVVGFGILFLLGGDEVITSDEESSDVTEVADDTEVEPDYNVDLDSVAEDVIDVDAMPGEEMDLIGTWEGSFISRGGIAYDLIIGIDSNHQVTATYFDAESRETVLARYYGVAHRRGNDEVVIEYTSSSIRPAGWDESGITLFGTIEDNTISGFFEFEGAQTGTARLRKDTLPTSVDADQLYRIRLTWEDAASQIGAFESLTNAINATPEGYSVFDGQGNVVFTR